MTSLDPSTLGGLPPLIGSARFAPYLNACGGNSAQGLRLYTWNVEASAAVLGSFGPLEVGLRNAMHHRLAAHFGRDDWWNAASVLRANESKQISHASEYLDRRKGDGGWGTGHLVAELRVSFWEGLLANRYHAGLWDPALKAAFPNYGGRRDSLRVKLERLRFLRNRAAHHEPIHARDLTVDYTYMCEVAGFISTDLRDWIASHSRLPEVVHNRQDTVMGIRPTRF